MLGWLLFFCFAAAWIGFGYWARRTKKWSVIVSVGGGFILGCLVFILVASIGVITQNETGREIDIKSKRQERLHIKREVAPSQKVFETPIHIYNEGEPIDIVRRSFCQQGGTIDECLIKKTTIPAVTDLGCTMREIDDGFIVEKEIKIKGLQSSTVYRWHVSRLGNITPANGHAIGISRP